MDITIVCVPYQNDTARWGYATGPGAILGAGLAEALGEHGHTVSAPIWIELPRSERTRDIVTNLGRIAARTSDAVREALERPSGFALVLEGDCNHAVGAIGGLARAAGDAGVAWFDAHGDLHTWATSESGYVGGMPYAVALGWDLDDWRLAAGLERPVRAEAAALLGTSDLDVAEIAALTRHPILHLSAADLEEQGAVARLGGALTVRAGEASAWYLHLDLDVSGPEEVPGGLTPAPAWVPRERLLEALESAARSLPVRAASLATYNAAADPTGRGARFALDAARAMLDAIGTRTGGR